MADARGTGRNLRDEMKMALVLMLVVAGVSMGEILPADQKAIRGLIQNYVDAREKGDVKAVEGLFTAEADQLVSTGEWRRGRAKLVEGSMASSKNNPAKRTIEVETIREIRSGVAIVDGRYIQTGGPAEGRREMWSTFVVEKTKGQWRIAAIRNMLPAAAR